MRDIKATVVEDPWAVLEKTIQEIEVTYDYVGVYEELVGAINDFINDYGDEYGYELETVLYPEDRVNCIVDYATAEEEASNIMSEGGLVRLYYYMGDCNFAADNLYWCNGYGNLERLTKEHLESFKYRILEKIEYLR